MKPSINPDNIKVFDQKEQLLTCAKLLVWTLENEKESDEDTLDRISRLKQLVRYPLLSKIVHDTPETVIDHVWEDYLSEEVLAELKLLTGLKSYRKILAEWEGATIEELFNNEW